MTKRNELVATAHLKKKGPKEILAVQKDRNKKAYREKEKSDRDKGTSMNGNVDCLAERKVTQDGGGGG